MNNLKEIEKGTYDIVKEHLKSNDSPLDLLKFTKDNPVLWKSFLDINLKVILNVLEELTSELSGVDVELSIADSDDDKILKIKTKYVDYKLSIKGDNYYGIVYDYVNKILGKFGCYK